MGDQKPKPESTTNEKFSEKGWRPVSATPVTGPRKPPTRPSSSASKDGK